MLFHLRWAVECLWWFKRQREISLLVQTLLYWVSCLLAHFIEVRTCHLFMGTDPWTGCVFTSGRPWAISPSSWIPACTFASQAILFPHSAFSNPCLADGKVQYQCEETSNRKQFPQLCKVKSPFQKSLIYVNIFAPMNYVYSYTYTWGHFKKWIGNKSLLPISLCRGHNFFFFCEIHVYKGVFRKFLENVHYDNLYVDFQTSCAQTNVFELQCSIFCSSCMSVPISLSMSHLCIYPSHLVILLLW